MQSRFALLVIDMQLVAFDGRITTPIVNGDELLENVASLITIARAASIPVIFVQTCASTGHPYARDMHGWEIHPSIGFNLTDHVIYKANSCAFDNTELQEVLVSLRTKAVVACGIWSEYCVSKTSISALRLGYDVLVAADAHGTVSASQQSAREIIARQNRYLKQHGAAVSCVVDLRKSLGFCDGEK